MQLEPNLADGFHNKKGRSSISKVRPNISIYSHLAPVRQTPVQIWEVGQKNLWKKRKNPSIQNARKQLMRLALRQTHLYCYDKMEVPPRFELGSQGFADPCLTTWPRHHMNLSRKKGTRGAFLQLTNGAGDEARTRYLHLGKVALYQMSYTRIWCLRSELNQRHADFQSAALPTELQRHVEPGKTRLRCFKNGDPERTRTVDLQRDRLAC